MSMNTRPTSEETEDDLLRFQREFLASGLQPAVKVVKKRKSNDIPPGNESQTQVIENTETKCRDLVTMDAEPEIPKRVKFDAPKMDVENLLGQDEGFTEEDDVESEMELKDMHITAVLNKIQERDTHHVPVMFPSLRTSAFPSVFHMAKRKPAEADGKKERKSIFARQFGKKSLADYGIATDVGNQGNKVIEPCPLAPLPDPIPIERLKHMYPSSGIISGSGLSSNSKPIQFSEEESKKIHEENLQRISAMSETEVLKEKEKLLSELDPKLVKFLQSRSKLTASKEERFLTDLGKGKVGRSGDTDEMDVGDGVSDKDQHRASAPQDYLEQKYLHMDVVETEKLAWTEMIPKTQRKDIKLQHRFDFDGNVLSMDAEVPSHLGLHHHGEDPDLPGYTLQELFILSRSNFTQQRVFAINMLGKIISKAKQGYYLELIEEPILDSLLQSGLLFLLRWSLDDQSETLLQASVFALHSLLCFPQAKRLDDMRFTSNRGRELPALSPGMKFKDDDGDYEVAQKDVIAGLLKMTILPRIRYILEICKPAVVTVNHCLDILIRISRHSLQSALKVYECPRLMEYVVNNLISVTWDLQASVLSPVPKAIALLRSICIAGRNVTSRLINDYKDLKTTIIYKYVSLSHDDEMCKLDMEVVLEAWKFWIICASYSFYSDTFRELFPIITGLIQSLTSSLSDASKESFEELEFQLKRGQIIFSLCGTALANCSDKTMVAWKELSEQIQLVATSICKILMKSEQNMNPDFLSLLAASLDFLSKYSEESNTKSGVLEKASFSENLSHHTLPMVFECVKLCRPYDKVHFCKAEKLQSLPELAVFSDVTVLASFQLLSAYLRCCVAACCLNKNLCINFCSTVTYIAKNFTWMLSTSENLSTFTMRLRSHCLYWAVNLYSLIMSMVSNSDQDIFPYANFYYLIAFRCFGLLGNGDEHMMHNLISSFLFNPGLIRAVTNYTGNMTQKMELLNFTKSLSQLMPDPSVITDSVLSALASIRATYLSSLAISPKILEESKQRFLHRSSEIKSYLLKPDYGMSCAPSDWPFMPLLQLYDQSIHRELPGGSLTHISYTLHYLCFLERHCKECLVSLSTTVKISRLMCVFLAGNDIFLEAPVKRCLCFLFANYCNLESPEELNFSQPIPGISSFYDFYLSLLEQYEGVSYGDELFSAVVMLPLHQLNGGISEIKKALWSDRKELLRILSVPISKLLLPVKWYLFPVETDVIILREYLTALANGYCSQLRCPALYLIAIHHTAQFMFNKELDVPVSWRKELCRSVLKIRHEDIRKHILHYDGLVEDELSKMGFRYTDDILDDRANDIKFLIS